MISIPNYQIGTQIYESANSLVYRGERNEDNQPVILKVLKEDYPTPEELTRYRQEYEMTHHLNLEGVVKTYGIKKYENTLVMVLEDFGGESLKRLMADRPFTLKEFLSLAIQITNTLGQIHTQNVIHKDINPANIVFNQATSQLKIIDFGISSRLPRENPVLKNPEQLEGTLAYISPEQTGRINRSMDYRTDLYSLGVTFYELLTGQLPFEAKDAMELVHCHIAKTPMSVCEMNSNVPPIISDIIIKLMAKNAEARYQSAFGVKADLEKCLENLTDEENLSGLNFKLAQNDFSGKLQIPQKLYGRENEVNILLQAFERVSYGKAEMMLVAGYSGVGKTALVHEVHKPMTKKRGYFAAGKFDQFQKNVPYFAITQAFNEFCHYLLTENVETLANWKAKILKVVGNNGQIIIDVVPDLELIIGTQPAITKVGPTEAQNRFVMFFLNFVKVLCNEEHPFILFIDDLQWVDSASLSLLKSMMLDDEIRHLFIIGAYRDNEVDSSHPFIMTVDELKKAKATINTLCLANLQKGDINQLLQDSLKCQPKQSQPLTDLIYQKTQGNAFFTHEFLKSLYEQALLIFDTQIQKWQWDIDKIKALSITDNVIELMANKIAQLSLNTQNVVKLAACIGNQFDLQTLSIISQHTHTDTLAYLWSAIEDDLLESSVDQKLLENSELDNTNLHFKFQHDRVQQAAYALIDDEQKMRIHLKIGQLLLANLSTEKRAERLFEMVDHLNIGQSLIMTNKQRLELVTLNLEAGKKAKQATAYEAARQYVKIAMDGLPFETRWHDHYALTLALYRERAEIESLNGDLEQSKYWIEQALKSVKTTLEQGELYHLLVLQYVMSGEYTASINTGRQLLKLLNIALPEQDLNNALALEFAQVDKNVAGRKIATLIEEPDMVDPEKKVVVKVLGNMLPACYAINPELLPLIAAKIVNLSLTSGYISEISQGYGFYALIVNSVQKDYQTAYAFEQLALAISKRFNHLGGQCQAYTFLNFVTPWVKPLKELEVINDQGYQAGLEAGEFQFAGYILNHKLLNALYQGQSLDSIATQLPSFLQFCRKTQNHWAIYTFLAIELSLNNLRGMTQGQLNFDTEENTEADFLADCHATEAFSALCFHHIFKSRRLYLYEESSTALESAEEAEKLLAFIPGMTTIAEHNFYHSLILITLYPTAGEQQAQYWEKLQANQKQMKIWSDNCPENFLHKYLLVAAEQARIEGKELEATMVLYNQAIASARENEFVQNEALANELTAKFWLEKEQDEFAKLYLTKAYYGYQQWGALTKLAVLEAKYPQWLTTRSSKILKSTLQSTTIMTSVSSQLQTSTRLDLDSVTKAAQTLAGEIVLSRLLEKMMHTLIENAGAERGLLILDKEGQWVIEAEGAFNLNEVTVLQSLPLENRLPSSIVNYVARSHEPVVLAHAMQEGIYTKDNYTQQHKLKSLLCNPIFHQGQLIGLLYLENNLIEGAFTPARLKIVDMLSSQAAISLENALLYRTLEQKVEERTVQLATANQEITLLNERLKQENLRMSAELDVAKQLQQMVLPKEAELQQVEGLDIAGFMAPADEVGGDYYDVLQHDGQIKIGIGDVTGHGLESGVLMLMVQTAVRTLLDSGVNNASQFLTTLNRTIYNNVQRMGTDKNLTLSLLDYQDGQLQVTGQHEEVLWVRQSGSIERIDTFDLGFSVGVIDDIADMVSQTHIELQPGDGIVLYTDGITEARDPNKALYGLERLCEVVSRNWHLEAKAIQQAVIADVRHFIGEQKVFDDITILVLKQK
jgi:predicted ATPase/serine phosphatase RsbU (regulator of sigma subunit)/tRNA A-37 threonylcarbamoyl transferase component Bud32